jgi:hypothetical protein
MLNIESVFDPALTANRILSSLLMNIADWENSESSATGSPVFESRPTDPCSFEILR